MAGTGRDSTDEWAVYDPGSSEPPGNGGAGALPDAPEPDALLATQHAASEAAACASRAAASSSAAAAAVERVERALAENGDVVRLAAEAAEAADRSAATATAIGEQAERALERIEWQIDAVATSVDASADYTASVERSIGRLHEDSAEASARAEAAAEVVTELSGRVESALAKLEAREQATARRADEAEREQRTLRSFTARADRIVDRLRDLEARASPATVWRVTGEADQ
jgi:peptidoglycan DL-endopeptidase CwlO